MSVEGEYITSGQYLAATGRAGPDWYLDEPELGIGDQVYLTGFHRLSTERDFGSGVGPIPMSKATEYAERLGLEPDMQRVFETVIYRMDDAYMRNEQTKQKAEQARQEREAARNAGKTKIR